MNCPIKEKVKELSQAINLPDDYQELFFSNKIQTSLSHQEYKKALQEWSIPQLLLTDQEASRRKALYEIYRMLHNQYPLRLIAEVYLYKEAFKDNWKTFAQIFKMSSANQMSTLIANNKERLFDSLEDYNILIVKNNKDD